MEQSEIEILVNELETRVDRLRSLYDQYFMGIERMPPSVPHKDVERRVQVLRREQIRNTGLRFRFQMVVQRLNTYQSYWLRICRQIEDGTYKRDVIRAKRKEKERVARESLPPESLDITGDLELEEVHDELPPVEPPTIAKAEKPPPKKYKSVELDLSEIDDLDDLLDEKPTQQRAIPAEVAKPVVKPPPPVPSGKPVPPATRPVTAPAASAPAPTGAAAAPTAAPSAPAVRPAPVAAGAAARPVWKKVSAPAAGVSIPIATPHKPILPTSLEAKPAKAAAEPKPEPSKVEPKPPPKAEPAPEAAKPLAGKPPIRPRPEPAPRAPLGPADLTDARVRQIYTEYVRAKRSQNESTASITYETMAKSIRESSEKLREKHGGKKVDFEVQVKDGKTILKPVVKG